MDELKVLLCWSICSFLLCGGVLWARRRSGDRSRLYLAWTWMVAGLLFLVRLLMAEAGEPIAGRILPPENLAGGLWIIMVLYLYPMEAICSGWLTWKRGLLFFFPGLLLSTVQFLLVPHSRELYSLMGVWRYFGEFNVWYRFCILFVVILFYALLLLYIPYNRKKSRVCHRWIYTYILKVMLISVCFFLFMLTGSPLASCVHLAVCMAVAVSVTYQELFVRFEAPREVPESVAADAPEVLPAPSEEPASSSLLGRLTALLDSEPIWRDPDLDLSDLALRLNTNRSYLSKAIQECGYKNFSDMMNRRRIADFLKEADAGQVASVQDAFFRVGFRSRETALRCFKRYVGLSPTDYIRSRMMPAETGSD